MYFAMRQIKNKTNKKRHSHPPHLYKAKSSNTSLVYFRYATRYKRRHSHPPRLYKAEFSNIRRWCTFVMRHVIKGTTVIHLITPNFLIHRWCTFVMRHVMKGVTVIHHVSIKLSLLICHWCTFVLAIRYKKDDNVIHLVPVKL